METEDLIYEAHKNYSVPAVENKHSHGIEYYDGGLWGNFYWNDECFYDGRVYYVRSFYDKSGYNTFAYICSSDLQGNDIQIISKEYEYWHAYIHVNVTGIYLYAGHTEYIWVKHLDFSGKTIGEFKQYGKKKEEDEDGKEPVKYETHDLYIYDNKVYFVHNVFLEGPRIECIDVDAGELRVLYHQEWGHEIIRLCASKDYLVFYERHYSMSGVERGWMLYHLSTGEVERISTPNRRIVFVDLTREIFWTERRHISKVEPEEDFDEEDYDEELEEDEEKVIVYWEPKRLFGQDRDEVIADLPVWKINISSFNEYDSEYDDREPGGTVEKRYFDGRHLYLANDPHTLMSLDQYGNTYVWTREGTQDYDKYGNVCYDAFTHYDGHDNDSCYKFIILGDYLFFDAIGDGEHKVEQYELTVKKSEPIRESWFDKELPESIVKEFESGFYEEIKEIDMLDRWYGALILKEDFPLECGSPVTVQINGKSYECMTNDSIKGRIEGMKQVYQENHIDGSEWIWYRIRYSSIHNVITLEKIWR